ncbi:aminoglycoside phosphotransferase family protein [Streptomyces sp. 130]|uniref:phosphotransferase family protein n=1 Tax=Streptomyces sp. 130 TaxID=2591006 RepID=UPI00117F8EE2|nr:aminoglycoside phosphotransferase family protein [Streptomyces sp. 130]TRV77309.1 aminoglycoside phosphotransferase family protein [Streptomyces sp. 130]
MPIDSVLSGVLGALGISPGLVASREPLTGGTYNAVSRVRLTDGRDWVVKAPPPGAGDCLSYEHGLLVNEVTFYRAAAGEPAVPLVVHAELGPAAPTGPYVVMSARPGRPWHELTGAMADGEEARLRTELGRVVGRLHGAPAPGGFGYPSQALGPLAPTWRQAFTTMTDAVLADARTYTARLPREVAEIRDTLAAASYVLDDVTRPALVHFDLWQGNILVTGAPGARRVGGVIDGERMFWGDPVADFVSLALLGDIEDDKDFLAGYGEEAPGGPVEFDRSLRLRLALYRAYLYLIMLVETVPRATAGEQLEWTWNEVAPRLAATLDEIRSATRVQG